MKFTLGSLLATASLLSFAPSVVADLHNAAVCVSDREYEASFFYKEYSTSYEILPDATNCACGYYRNRNTGDEQWDQCPDCTFDGLSCNSAGWHIGGDEMNWYCTKYCNAQGSEAN